MLDSIWQLLANYGLNTEEIADGIHSLIKPVVDAEGNITGYEGTLGVLANFPLIGDILKGFASFAPAVTTTVESNS